MWQYPLVLRTTKSLLVTYDVTGSHHQKWAFSIQHRQRSCWRLINLKSELREKRSLWALWELRLYFLFFSFLYFPQHSMCYCELHRHLINAGWLSKWKAQVYFGQMSFGDTPFITYPFDKTSHPQIPPNIYYLIFKVPSHSPQGERRGQDSYSHFDRWEKLKYKEFNSPLPW